MFTVTRITEVSALYCPPPPGRFRHRSTEISTPRRFPPPGWPRHGNGSTSLPSLSRARHGTTENSAPRRPIVQVDLVTGNGDEAHVVLHHRNHTSRTTENTLNDVRESTRHTRPEKHAERIYAVQPTTTTASINALISAKRTTCSGASHVMITPANRHRTGRYVLLYSNSIGLTSTFTTNKEAKTFRNQHLTNYTTNKNAGSSHTPTNSPPLPGLAHWTDIKVSHSWGPE